MGKTAILPDIDHCIGAARPNSHDRVWWEWSAVLLSSVATYMASTLGFDAVADGLAVVEADGYARLIYSSRSENRVSSLSLGAVVAPTAAPGAAVAAGAEFGADLALQQTVAQPRLFIFSSYNAPLRAAQISTTGLPGIDAVVSTSIGTLAGVTSFAVFEGGAVDIGVVAQRGVAGLRIFQITDNGAMTLIGTILDGPKAYLADISDLAAITVGTDRFLLVLSALENGITSYRIDTNGSHELVDSLGVSDGLSVNGPAAMQIAEIAGQQFAVIASTLSDSLSVVRINAVGALFQTDHVIDDLNTRFADTVALDLFVARGRVFAVTAGSDAGVSVFELLGNGKLSPYATFPLETGAGISSVTSIETKVLGDKVAVLMVDARGDRIHHFELSLTTLGSLINAAGGTVTGTALDDRIIGSAAAETLQGGLGNDWLHDGGGLDLLRGGAGRDVFVFDRDGQADRVADFERGTDRLDLSDWGRIYSASALSIVSTPTGAEIRYGTELLYLDSVNAQSLSAGGFSDADFIF